MSEGDRVAGRGTFHQLDLGVAGVSPQGQGQKEELQKNSVLFDGTHGTDVNWRTRTRDQKRAPIASDITRSMWEQCAVGECTFALAADVSEAPRQVGAYSSTRLAPGGSGPGALLLVKACSALRRIAQKVVGKASRTWHFLVADDYYIEAERLEYQGALPVFLVLCATCEVPLS